MIKTHREFIAWTADLMLAADNQAPGHLVEYRITLEIAEGAKTVLFSAEQALALRPALERFAERSDYRLPWPFVMAQFDRRPAKGKKG